MKFKKNLVGMSISGDFYNIKQPLITRFPTKWGMLNQLISLTATLGLILLNQVAFAQCSAIGNEYVCNNQTLYEGTLYQASLYDKVTINTTVPEGTAPMQGYGMFVDFSYGYKQVNIATAGARADGIIMKKSNTVSFGDGLIIKTSGSSADGINLAEDTKSGGSIIVGNNAQIESQLGMGIRVNNSTGEGYINSITVGDNLIVITHGAGSNGYDAYGYGIYAGSRTWKQTDRKGLSELRVGENASITTNGGAAHAVYANAGGLIQLGDNANITTTAANNAFGLYAQTSATGGVSKAGRIDLLGDITITSPTTAIYSSGVGASVASYNSDTSTATSGVYKIQGGMIAAGGGAIDLRMIGSSSITGNITSQGTNSNINLDLKDSTVFIGVSKTTTGGVLNLKMTGANSAWHLQGDSTLTNLTISDSNIYLGDQSIAVTDANKVTLSMIDLAGGSGIFHVRTDILETGLQSKSIADLIKVTGTASGNHGIMVNDNNTGGASVTGQEIVRVAEIADGDERFTLANASGYVDMGAYRYYLNSDTAGSTAAHNWYLSGVEAPVIPPVDPPVIPPVDPPVIPPVDPPVIPPVDPPVIPPVDPPVIPPVIDPPVIDPPVIDPPVVDPPVVDPPVIDPPVIDPPVIPPVDPPVIDPPVIPPVDPPVIDPPVIDPPVIDPPVIDPPVVDPPVVDPPVVDPPMVTPPIQPPAITPPVITPILSNAANHSVNILNINYLMNNAETETLLQRMGELRETDGLGGAWSRVYGGKFNSISSKQLQGFDFKYTGIQFGVDRLISNEYGRFYVGGMAGYTDGEAKYQVGKGDVRSLHVGAYMTFKHSNDFYVDAIIKYNNMQNKFTTQTGGGYGVNGKGTMKGFSASLEAGKRFYFQAKDNGWYVEPQAQIAYAHQGSTTVRSSNGLKTHLDSLDSLLGRMSVIVGYKITDGANPINVYFKTGVVKEFDGKTGYTFNNAGKNNYKIDGTWWDNAIGVNAQFSKKHNLYFDVNYASGSKFNKTHLNLGYRYEF